MLEALENQFTKYEIARILGARSLQIAMDAPLLLKIDEKELEAMNYNPIEIAKRELVAGVLPITINRPMPKRKEAKIKKLTREEVEAIKKKEKEVEAEKEKAAEKEIEEKENKEAPAHSSDLKDDEESKVEEVKEEKKVFEDAEIMEMANPDDETEETESSREEEI